MNGTLDRRFVAGVLLAGAVLAMVGNGLHPIIDPHGGGAELIAAAQDTSYWVVLHLVVVAAAVLLTAGTVILMRGFTGTAGEPTARLASVLAVVGGSIFAIQLGGIDGAIMPALGEQLAAGGDEATVMALAEAMAAFDISLLAIVTTVYLGGMFVAVGLTFQRTEAFAPWVRWTALVAGSVGMVVGVLMYLGVADAVAFYGFRLVALAVTIATFGIVVDLRRADAPASAPASPPSAATA